MFEMLEKTDHIAIAGAPLAERVDTAAVEAGLGKSLDEAVRACEQVKQMAKAVRSERE
ncbi:hypothetical protein P9727_09260 [Parageobacillus thermoglucosidasius]|nr:hypothetical protein [Parageobacillus thermoglucosidasius]MED4982859.1 hypothetical protein [Parageobacillus thermoglucosidasius]